MSMLLTEDFVKLLIESIHANLNHTNKKMSSDYMEDALKYGVIEDYDMVHAKDYIERRAVARIIHETLLHVLHEKDEDNWMSVQVLKDIYDCHTCVRHIAQVYAKGIMEGINTTLFGIKEKISLDYANLVITRIWDKDIRIVPAYDIQTKVKLLSQTEMMHELLRKENLLLIDVRDRELHDNNPMYEGSINIPLKELSLNPYLVSEHRDIPIVLYCSMGYQSTLAGELLLKHGYRDVSVISSISSMN